MFFYFTSPSSGSVFRGAPFYAGGKVRIVPLNMEVSRFNVLTVKNEPLMEDVLKNVEGAVCVQGMPGIANVGKSVVDFLAESNGAAKVFQIYFSDFPSHVSVDDAGRIKALKSEIYLYWDKRAKRHVFLLTGDAQPTSNIGANILSKHIASLLHDLKVKVIVSLGAMPTERVKSKPRVFAAVTNVNLLREYSELLRGVEVLKNGVVIGMNGLVPCFASNLYGISGLIFLSETLSVLERDARASYALAELLYSKFMLNVDLESFRIRCGLTGFQSNEQPIYLS